MHINNANKRVRLTPVGQIRWQPLLIVLPGDGGCPPLQWQGLMSLLHVPGLSFCLPMPLTQPCAPQCEYDRNTRAACLPVTGELKVDTGSWIRGRTGVPVDYKCDRLCITLLLVGAKSTDPKKTACIFSFRIIGTLQECLFTQWLLWK